VVAQVARGGDLGREEALMRLVLASTSPQRRAILEQLRIPFDVVEPTYEEHDPPDADPVELVRAHAEGKARSVHGAAAITLGVDTTVHLGGRLYGKPADEGEARAMVRELAGASHLVVSGLCLLGPGFSVLEHAVTRVTFRRLAGSEVDAYVSTGEWRGRAGGYAIQGLGARLVAGVDGDYLNVVGLPAALLVDVLAAQAPKLLQIRPDAVPG
jgi:septum formation protein